MELIFYNSSHHLKSLFSENENENDIPASSLKILGQPLIIRNISIASKVMDIDVIKIPKELSSILKLVQNSFPSICIQGYNSSQYDDDDNNNNQYHRIDNKKSSSIKIPINSIIYYKAYKDRSHSSANNSGNITSTSGGSVGNDDISSSIATEPIIYPWDFLNAVEKVLNTEIMQTIISPSASIAKSSIIEGPCIIEDNVTIDDFCKIKGPVYIGKNSYIGTSSLVRDCMIGDNTILGFSCEIRRSYLAGHDEIAHLNLIGDSVIGENVWVGGSSLTANVLLTKQNITCETDDGKSVDLGTHRFGAVIGNNCTIGTFVMILPGRCIPANTMIQFLGKTYQITGDVNRIPKH